MPEIIVQALPGTLDSRDRAVIKRMLKKECPSRFSIAGRQLTGDSFTVVFPVYQDDSELSHDVIIRIYLHRDAERLTGAQDNSKMLTAALEAAVNVEDGRQLVKLTRFGVMLFFGDIYWSELSV